MKRATWGVDYIELIINHYILNFFSHFSFFSYSFMGAKLPKIANCQSSSVNFSFDGFPPKETDVYMVNS